MTSQAERQGRLPMAHERRWWNDESYNEELHQKIQSPDNWYIRYGEHDGEDGIGKVVQIIYAGYRVQLPNNTTKIVNPDVVSLADVSANDYSQLVALWLEADAKRCYLYA